MLFSLDCNGKPCEQKGLFFLVKNCDQRKRVFDHRKIAGMEQA
jgi:hypothetical protein